MTAPKKDRANRRVKLERSKPGTVDSRTPEYRRQLKATEEYRTYRREYEKARKRNDPLYAASVSIRDLIRKTIRRNHGSKSKKTSEILGCSIADFVKYISGKFKDGMSWDNHGAWHLDHIIPASKATSKEELIALNHYTNFQPLWAEENLKKGNR